MKVATWRQPNCNNRITRSVFSQVRDSPLLSVHSQDYIFSIVFFTQIHRCKRAQIIDIAYFYFVFISGQQHIQRLHSFAVKNFSVCAVVIVLNQYVAYIYRSVLYIIIRKSKYVIDIIKWNKAKA